MLSHAKLEAILDNLEDASALTGLNNDLRNRSSGARFAPCLVTIVDDRGFAIISGVSSIGLRVLQHPPHL